MKTYKNILLSSLLLFSLSSCSDWFEVKPENEISKEDLFSTYDGYRTALNGIYRNLTATSLYGQELSFGFVSLLGQNYEIPEYMKPYYFVGRVVDYEYDNNEVKSITQGIWEKAFNTIANCNVLIQNTESRGVFFFPEGENERNILIGEAKGIRALLHLDMLRLFAPAPVTGDDGAYIPYVSEYLTSHPTHLPTSVVLDSVISDLKQTQSMLAYNDTLYNSKMLSSVTNRFHDNVTDGAQGGAFFAFRGTRMNYVAATALLARAYQYKGDKQAAYQCAKEVLRYQTEKGWYTFTSADKLQQENRNYIHAKLYDDILLAFSNSELTKMNDDWLASFYSYQPLLIKNAAHLFTGDLNDFRYANLIFSGYSLKWEAVTEDPNMSWLNSDIIKYELPQIPIIRLSEMYYIICEYLAETDLPEAIRLLGSLRLARGCTAELSTSLTKDDFLDRLYNDATREFIVEGQTFYLYKRLNKDMYNGEYPIKMDGKYIIPLPDSESNIQ